MHINVPTESQSKWFCLHPLNYWNNLCFLALNFNQNLWNRKKSKQIEFQIEPQKLNFGSSNYVTWCTCESTTWCWNTLFRLQLEKRLLVPCLLNSVKDQIFNNRKSYFAGPAWKGNHVIIPQICSFRLCHPLHFTSLVNKFSVLLQQKKIKHVLF